MNQWLKAKTSQRAPGGKISERLEDSAKMTGHNQMACVRTWGKPSLQGQEKQRGPVWLKLLLAQVGSTGRREHG